MGILPYEYTAAGAVPVYLTFAVLYSTYTTASRLRIIVCPDARSLNILILVVFNLLLAVSRVMMNVVVGWPSTLSINPRIYFLLPINRSIKQSEIRSKGHSSTSKYSTIRPRDIFKSAQPWSSANNTPEYTGRKLSLGLISQGIRREFGVENLRSIWATT